MAELTATTTWSARRRHLAEDMDRGWGFSLCNLRVFGQSTADSLRTRGNGVVIADLPLCVHCERRREADRGPR